jgi:hypothetical protein
MEQDEITSTKIFLIPSSLKEWDGNYNKRLVDTMRFGC